MLFTFWDKSTSKILLKPFWLKCVRPHPKIFCHKCHGTKNTEAKKSLSKMKTVIIKGQVHFRQIIDLKHSQLLTMNSDTHISHKSEIFPHLSEQKGLLLEANHVFDASQFMFLKPSLLNLCVSDIYNTVCGTFMSLSQLVQPQTLQP